MDRFQCSQGAALSIDVTLRDTTGAVVTGYDGTQPLLATLWPGGTRASSFSPTAVWVIPASGTIEIRLTEAETLTLGPGEYQLLLRLQDAGTWVDAYRCTVDILAGAGSTIAPATYPLDFSDAYSQLLKYGRSWLKELETDDDEAGFAEQMGRARTWIEDIAHAHYRVGVMTPMAGGVGLGPHLTGMRSKYLTDELAAGHLLVTDQVKECAAHYALHLICKGQVGVGDSAKAYAGLARMYLSEAWALANCLNLGIDTDGDGQAEINIDCSSVNVMYG